MALDSLVTAPASLRTDNILGSSDALLSAQTTSLLHPSDAASGLPTTDVLSGLSAGLPSTSDATLTDGPIADAANAAVTQLHANLESTADANGLVGSVHGVTGLGETVGLGKIGEANLLTDVLTAPSALSTGDISFIAHVVPDAGSVAGAVDNLGTGILSDAGTNPAVLTNVTSAFPAVGAVQLSDIESTANAPILALHASLEAAADMDGTSGAIHGLTNLGETIGLGKLGGSNLATDIVSTPGNLLSGDTSSITHLPTDVSNITVAATGLVSGVEADLASGTVFQNPTGDAVAILQSASTFPVASLANGVVDAVHGSLEGATDGLTPGTVHAVTGLGNTVGLGEIGGSNLVTDVLDAPTTLVSGHIAPILAAPGDIAAVGQAAGDILPGIASDLAGPLTEAVTHPLTGSGILAGELPGQAVVDGIVAPVTAAADIAGSISGAAPVVSAATGVVDSAIHAATDTLHAPADAITGLAQGLSPIAADISSTAAATGDVVGVVVDTATHLSDSAGTLDGGLSQGEIAAALAPATSAVTAGAGALAPLASLTSGGTGDAGSGAHDLAGATAGPAGSSNAANVDLVGAVDTPLHVVDIHAVSVPASTPVLPTVSLLSGSAISFPSLAGSGTDALTGALSGAGGSATAPVAAAVAHAGADISAIHVDLPIAHADPLAALAHAVHHA